MLRKVLVWLPVVVVVSLVCVAGAGAAPPAPAWSITSLSAPTSFAPGYSGRWDLYHLTVTNIGDAPTDGTPFAVSDTLPAGLTFDPKGGIAKVGARASDPIETYPPSEKELETISCGEGPPVSCTDGDVLQPGQSLQMWVAVNVEANAPASVVNEVSVSGGGAPSVSASETTAITSTLPVFGFQGFAGGFLGAEGSPASQAGSHPYEAAFDFSLNTLPDHEFAPGFVGGFAPAGNPKQITVNLPAGLVVNPTATTRCTEAQLESDHDGEELTDGCPDSSAVGTVWVTIGGYDPTASSGLSGLYNMVPPPGVPAELGFDAVNLGLYVHLFGGVRTGGDYGLTATANDVLQHGSIVAVKATLWGDPSDPSHDGVRGRCAAPTYFQSHDTPCATPLVAAPFLTMPSACSGPLTTSIGSHSWQEPAHFVEESVAPQALSGDPVGVTGCEKLHFSPSLSMTPESQTAGVPTGSALDLRLPQRESLEPATEELLSEANLRDA